MDSNILVLLLLKFVRLVRRGGLIALPCFALLVVLAVVVICIWSHVGFVIFCGWMDDGNNEMKLYWQFP